MKKYIIVKYAKDNYPDGKAPLSMSIHDTYSAKQIGIDKEFYTDFEEAEKDAKRISLYNLGVFYGVVEGI